MRDPSVATVMGDLISEASALHDRATFRRATLAHARRLVGFDSAIFLPMDDEAPSTLDKSSVFGSTYRHYRAHRATYREDLAKGERAAREGGYIDTEVYSFAERRRLRFFSEILQPQGITSRVMAYVGFRSHITATIHLCRHDRGRPFRPEHLHTFLGILPAIALASAALQVDVAPSRDALDELSPRERQIVEHVRRGCTNKEIAQLLGTSPLTVRNQLSRIFRQLRLESRSGLAAWAERGLGRR